MPDQIERPEPHEAPDGYAYVAVPAGPEWRIEAGKRCRRAFGSGTKACGAPSAGALNRARFITTGTWWAYCEEHMYGKWCENGQVMLYVLRPVEEGESG